MMRAVEDDGGPARALPQLFFRVVLGGLTPFGCTAALAIASQAKHPSCLHWVSARYYNV